MRRSTLRRTDAETSPAPRDIGLHSARSRAYDLLAPAEADRLLDAAITLLAEVGCRFDPGTEADTLLAAAGCAVRPDGVVLIPEAVTRRALESCAKSASLWNRDGTASLTLDADHCWFLPGMTCIKVHDLDGGALRDSTRDDLAMVTRLCEGLDNIDAVCVACKDVPNSTLRGEIGEFLCLMENSTKPVEFLCEYTASLEAAIEMAVALRGGRAELAAKPYFLHLVTPLPLGYAAAHSEQVILAARAGVPLSVGSLAIGGASAPITTAGCVVHCLATDFAGMVLGQAAAPGSFCIGSTNPYFMEPSTGGIGNLPQTMLAELMICQVRRRLGLPSFTGMGGEAHARRFGQDSVFEVATMMGQIFHTRPATCDYLGSIDQGITYSMHALLFCHDIAGLLRAMWQGAVIDDETLALDLMREIGPFGSVLGRPHTARNCRTHHWPTGYFGGMEPLSTTDRPDEDLFTRIDRDLRARLAEPGPPPLPPALLAELRAIHDRYS